jgi:hypothetical protein
MALQGNLRDFSASEILQLVGTQKKSGCLSLEWSTERAVVWVLEGRIVSTRQPGLVKEDPLLAFLRVTHRLSDEQHRGLLTIQKESGRDIEDLLLNGRYLDEQELAGFIERQILGDLARIVRWDNGTYRFDPNSKWTQAPLVMLSMEGVMIEAARRADEEKRFVTLFRDPHQLLGVRDLPDPDDSLSDEERELFGIIDGHHTVASVVQAAPLSEYEAYEALQRMLDANWIEFVGRQDPGSVAPAPSRTTRPQAKGNPIVHEFAIAALVLLLMGVLRFAGVQLAASERPSPRNDVYAAAQLRDLRYALALYQRENGHYPAQLQDLVEDHWVGRDQVSLAGYAVNYRLEPGGSTYRLDLDRDR